MPKLALNEIPAHLREHIVDQNADLYTPIDHAAWRFILKLSTGFFSKHAHQKYLSGLHETGISTDRIPLISEMDACLKKFGWRAVAVTGFIPPAAFMEFQSLGILPIACDMRKIENIAYTPAPDIVHEAAGHAPIIADPEYAHYLRSYGEISRKAIYSKSDMEIYYAIRTLSETKEDPSATDDQINSAQKSLDDALAQSYYVSEAAYLARMYWWTAEYGLIGNPADPKIYGAGLLSSIGESFHCLDSKINHVPFSLDCLNVSYDITRPQPQLFVAPDFASLSVALEEFSKTMAFSQGGTAALAKAVQAQAPTTTVFSSGLQVSGVLKQITTDQSHTPCYLQWLGPTQLAHHDHELPEHSAQYHREGFGSPLGLLKNGYSLESTEAPTWGEPLTLEFASGIVIKGTPVSEVKKNGKRLVLSLTHCTVTLGQKTLFLPEWGTYDMSCGQSVISVFGGPADQAAYERVVDPHRKKPRGQKSNHDSSKTFLYDLYSKVRHLRDTQKDKTQLKTELKLIADTLTTQYPHEWLIRWELLELLPIEQTRKELLEISSHENAATRESILRGLQLLEQK